MAAATLHVTEGIAPVGRAMAREARRSGGSRYGGRSRFRNVCIEQLERPTADQTLHARLTDVLRKYDVNDYAASVRVYALKP